MFTSRKGILTAAAAALAIPVFAGSAHALATKSFTEYFTAPGDNISTDLSREYLIDRVRDVDSAGNPIVGPATIGQIDVGDSFRGMANFKQMNDNSVGQGTPYSEFTGVFQIKVIAKIPDPNVPGNYILKFGPDPAFAEAVALGVGGQAMIIQYEDYGQDYAHDYSNLSPVPNPVTVIDDGTVGPRGQGNPPGLPPSSADVSVGPYLSEEGFISTATNGTLFWALGFTGAGGAALPGEGWESTTAGPDNVLPFFGVNSTFALASVNFGLNRLATGGLGDGIPLVQQTTNVFSNPGLVDFTGSSDIKGVKNLDTPFETSNRTTINFFALPLPASVWSGLSLMAVVLGARFKRLRRAAQ